MNKKITLLLLISFCGNAYGKTLVDRCYNVCSEIKRKLNSKAYIVSDQATQAFFRGQLTEYANQYNIKTVDWLDPYLTAAVAGWFTRLTYEPSYSDTDYKIRPATYALGAALGEGASHLAHWGANKSGLKRPKCIQGTRGTWKEMVGTILWDATAATADATVRALVQVAIVAALE